MENHWELSDPDYETQFANATLNPKLFSHEAHLRLAWIHISKYGVDSAIQNICSQLKHYAKVMGVSSKYNETVTVAAIRVVDHFKRKSKSETFQQFIEENSQLKTHFRELIGAHYTTDIFKSELAKKNYLEPELLPFD